MQDMQALRKIKVDTQGKESLVLKVSALNQQFLQSLNVNYLYLYYKVLHMKLKTIQARIPEGLYKNVEEMVEGGLYATTSEAVRDSIRKTFAEQNRVFLRNLAKKHGITKEEMLREWERVRHAK